MKLILLCHCNSVCNNELALISLYGSYNYAVATLCTCVRGPTGLRSRGLLGKAIESFSLRTMELLCHPRSCACVRSYYLCNLVVYYATIANGARVSFYPVD